MEQIKHPNVEALVKPLIPNAKDKNTILCKTIIQELKERDLFSEFKNLYAPNDKMSTIHLVATYLVAVSCVVGTSLLPTAWWAVSALASFPIMGAVHCILGNYVHNTTHGATYSNKKFNRFVGRLLSANMLYSYDYFTYVHEEHHDKLGQEGIDPEMINLLPTLNQKDKGWVAAGKFVKTFFLNGKAWVSTVLADLPLMIRQGRGDTVVESDKAKWTAKLSSNLRDTVVFWGGLVSLLIGTGLLTNLPLLMSFVFVWFGSKASVYHLVRCSRELFDHFGMSLESDVLDYTRKMPDTTFTLLYNGLNDNQHPSHHLFERVPMANLKKAHEILMQAPTYAQRVQTFDNYFWGENNILDSMIEGVKKQ